jgi:hypothetical protein
MSRRTGRCQRCAARSASFEGWLFVVVVFVLCVQYIFLSRDRRRHRYFSRTLFFSSYFLPSHPLHSHSQCSSFSLSAFSLAQLRAVGLLWKQFIADIRWHWFVSMIRLDTCFVAHPIDFRENGALLAGAEIPDDKQIDLQQCLAQQKFVMLNYCIQRKYGEKVLDGVSSK